MIDSGECDKRVNYGCNISTRTMGVIYLLLIPLPADLMNAEYFSVRACCVPQLAVLKLTEVTGAEYFTGHGTVVLSWRY